MMKNKLPFAALTFAFTIAGACLGYLVHDIPAISMIVILVAVVGATAAGLCGEMNK